MRRLCILALVALACAADLPRAGDKAGGKILHTRSHKDENMLENATESPLDLFPVKIHWESDNPLENTPEKCNYVGKCH